MVFPFTEIFPAMCKCGIKGEVFPIKKGKRITHIYIAFHPHSWWTFIKSHRRKKNVKDLLKEKDKDHCRAPGYSRALNGSFRRAQTVIPKVRLCPREWELFPNFPLGPGLVVSLQWLLNNRHSFLAVCWSTYSQSKSQGFSYFSFLPSRKGSRQTHKPTFFFFLLTDPRSLYRILRDFWFPVSLSSRNVNQIPNQAYV